MTLTLEELRALVTRQRQQREEDRRWLAREIHSTLAQDLTVLSMELSLLERRILGLAPNPSVQDIEAIRAKVAELSGIVRKTIEWTRWVKNRLRPKVLDEFGLPAAVKWRAEEFARETSIECNVVLANETIEMPPAMATDCFRIVEEVLNHVVHVANVRQAEIRVFAKGGTLNMEFSYDGSDTCDEGAGLRDSLWLLEIWERAVAWGGKMTRDTAEAKGSVTRLLVSLPLGNAGGRAR